MLQYFVLDKRVMHPDQSIEQVFAEWLQFAYGQDPEWQLATVIAEFESDHYYEVYWKDWHSPPPTIEQLRTLRDAGYHLTVFHKKEPVTASSDKPSTAENEKQTHV